MKDDLPEHSLRILDQALELEPDAQEAFLRAQIPNERELARVRSLLERGQRLQSRFDSHATWSNSSIPKRIGDLELIEELGFGGSGTVFRARNTQLDRIVAVKILRFDADEELRQRFRREARALAALQHDGIAKVFGVEHIGGLDVIEMEYIDGTDLASEIDGQRRRGIELAVSSLLPSHGSVAYQECVVSIVAEVADALAHCHSKSLIHRDVKPSNILIERSTGHAKLVDFGIARDGAIERLTRTNQNPGTPAYMSPEQLQGKSVTIDARADVYSLGVVLFEALTLTHPLTAIDENRRRASASELDRDVPSTISEVCERAMAIDRERRFGSAAEFATELRGAWQRRDSSHGSVGHWSRRLFIGLVVLGASRAAWWGIRRFAGSQQERGDSKPTGGYSVRWEVLTDDSRRPLRRTWVEMSAVAEERGKGLPTVEQLQELVDFSELKRIDGEFVLEVHAEPNYTIKLPACGIYWTKGPTTRNAEGKEVVQALEWSETTLRPSLDGNNVWIDDPANRLQYALVIAS